MDDNESKRDHIFIPNTCLDKTTDYHTGLESSIVKMLAKLLVFSAFNCKELKDVSDIKSNERTKMCVDDFDTIMRWERSKNQVHSLQIDCIMTCINDYDTSTLDEDGLIIRAPSIFIHSKSSNYKYIYKLLERITTIVESLDKSESSLCDILCICSKCCYGCTGRKLTRVICEIINASIIAKRIHVTNVGDYNKPLEYIL